MTTCERRTVYTSSRRSTSVNVAIHVSHGARAMGRGSADGFEREATSVGADAAAAAVAGSGPAPELAGTLGGGLLGVRI